MKRFATPLLFAVIVLVTVFGPWTGLHDWLRAHCTDWPAVRVVVSCAPE